MNQLELQGMTQLHHVFVYSSKRKADSISSVSSFLKLASKIRSKETARRCAAQVHKYGLNLNGQNWKRRS